MATGSDQLMAWMPEEFRQHFGWEYHADRHEDRGPGGTIVRFAVLGWGSCSCGAEFGTKSLPLPPEDVGLLYTQHLPEGFTAWHAALERWRFDQIEEHPHRLPGNPPLGWDDDPRYIWRG